MRSLSIIVPCYNEEETVNIFYQEINRISQKLHDYSFEFIFINDGSKDNTIHEMNAISEIDGRVAIIDFSRNFGKEAALLAGLEYSKGDAIIVMDVDLQDPPELIFEFVKHWEDGVDIVYARRSNRDGEPPIRSFFARMFYKIINKFSDVDIVDGARDYRLMSRQAVDSLLEMKEHNRFSKGLFMWVGYDSKLIEYEHVERVAGTTSWSFIKLFGYAIEGIISFSTFPLRIASILGTFVSGIAMLFMVYVVIKAAILGNAVDGWASLTSIILFLGGIQLVVLGVIGEYLSRIFSEVKGRPQYIVKKYVHSELHDV